MGRNEKSFGGRISIHALLAESDSIKFVNLRVVDISIHALLAESDAQQICRASAVADFYPRSPCGERLYGWNSPMADPKFLSTLSLRRATLISMLLPHR